MATLGNYGQAYTGKVIDPSQGGAVVDYTPSQPQQNQSITPASLAPQAPITPVVPPETPVPNVSAELQATLDSIEKQYAPLPNEGQVTDIQRKIAQLTGETAQETARRSQLENNPEVQAQRQNVTELTNRLRNIQAQSNAIPLKIQEQFAGRGATTAGIAPIQAAAQRQNAIEALTTTALLQGAQGNLTLALDNVDRAIKAEFEPKKAELVALQANLEAIKNDPASSREEKRRAAQQQAIVADRQKRIALEEENKRAVGDAKITLMKNNPQMSSQAIAALQQAQTPEDVAIISNYFGLSNLTQQQQFEQKMQQQKFLQDEKQFGLKYALDQQKLQEDRRQFDIKQQVDLIKTSTEQAEKAQTAEQKSQALQSQKEASIPVLDAKINIIDGLLKNQNGLSSMVGTNAYSRLANPYTAYISSEKQDFVAGVNQLISQATLDALLQLKAQGGTLGALSEKEGGMLKEAASKIGTWQILDKTGKVIGYDTSEKSFIEELNTIKASTQRIRDAITQAQAATLPPEDTAQINQLFGNQTTQTQEFNPANYY